MSKQKFKVGDRVVVTNAWDEVNGRIGTIVEIDGSRVPYKVYLDKPGNNYDKLIWAAEVKHAREKHPVIVITSDGKATTATLRKGKKVLKTATATCSEKDTFSFDEGARIAFERLQGRDPFPAEKKPKYYNGKIVCIKSATPTFFTAGRVYKVVNGRFRGDNGSLTSQYESVDEINHTFCSKFIPLVED